MDGRSLALVAGGGFAGAVCRYVISLLLPTAFPWGTLAVNVAGAFLLGLVVYEGVILGRLSRKARLLASTGFISSFTTYSTFAAETIALNPTLAVANVVATYALGLLAVLCAREVVRWL